MSTTSTPVKTIKQKSLPSGVRVTRKNIFTNKKGNNYRLDFKIPTKNDGDEYYKSLRVLPKPEKSVWEQIQNYDFDSAVNKINAELNEPVQSVESSIYQFDVVDDDVVAFNEVFLKFRDVLIDERDNISNELAKTTSGDGTSLTKDQLTNDKPTNYFIDNSATTENKKKYVALLEAYYIITMDNITDVFPIDKPEYGILTDEENRETALYIIGQVFNIINPGFNDNLYDAPAPKSGFSMPSLSMPSLPSFFSSAKIAPETVLNLITPTSSNLSSMLIKSSDNKRYYVGGKTADGKMDGQGMIRWQNNNFFEGTFKDNAIENGTFFSFSAADGKHTRTKVDENTDKSIFDMENGTIKTSTTP